MNFQADVEAQIEDLKAKIASMKVVKTKVPKQEADKIDEAIEKARADVKELEDFLKKI